MLSLTRDQAVIPLGRKFAKVAEEPCMKEARYNGQPYCVTHFLARGQNNELIQCTATRQRAREAVQVNIGNTVIVDVTAKITAIENTLEYAYEGFFICIDPRQ